MDQSVQGMRALNAALGLVLAQHDAIGKIESVLADEYVNTFAPGNDHNRAIRRVLERILWECEQEHEGSKEDFLKNLRSSARELYQLKVEMEKAKETGAVCDGSIMACILPDPAECPVHSIIYKRMIAAFRAFKEHGTSPVPDPSRTQTPGGGDGIVIPIPGAVAAAMGFRTIPDGSGGAVFFKRS